MANIYTEQLLIRLSKNDLSKLKETAKKQRLPVSTFVRSEIFKNL
jgi:predicted DNA binding CopG/RHH family protein